jgi:hypothetical protein
MFKMFIGYYLLAVYDPHCVVNDGFHDLIEIIIPEGTILRPIRPAAVSCRTHLLGRVMDVMQALFGQRNPAYRCAAGFSDSPHLFYSGFKPNGEWFLLYQIGFGGVPARPIGDGRKLMDLKDFIPLHTNSSLQRTVTVFSRASSLSRLRTSSYTSHSSLRRTKRLRTQAALATSAVGMLSVRSIVS